MDKSETEALPGRERALEELSRHYSKTVVDHCLSPRNFMRMSIPDGYGKVKGEDGDTFEIFVRLKNEIVASCTFFTDGCAAMVACGSIATELVKGHSIRKTVDAVSAEGILRALGGLPEGNLHCAHKTAQAFKRAVADVYVQRRSPWKKNYRKF